MTLKQRTFDGQPSGTAVTVANSDDNGDAAFSNVGTGFVFDNTVAFQGGGSLKLPVTSGGATATANDSGLSTTRINRRFAFRLSALPGVGVNMRLVNVVVSATAVARIIVEADHLVFQTTNGTTTLKEFTGVLSVNTWYVITFQAETGNTGASKFRMDYYVGTSSTPAEAGYSSDTVSTGQTGNITAVSFGSGQTMAATLDLWLDSDQVDDGPATAYPLAALSTATANAGPDATVDPNLVGEFTLNGSASSGLTSPVWEDITAGPPVTVPGSGLTRVVPVVAHVDGATRTYQLRHTTGSPSDTVTITFLPHTRWIKTVGGLSTLRRVL